MAKDKKVNGGPKPARRRPTGGLRFDVRLRNRELKRAISKAAKEQKMSLNTFINEALVKATGGTRSSRVNSGSLQAASRV